MPNKTIYVSEKDASLFEQAKLLAGEALSSVIVRALREFVTRREEKQKGMKEITLKVGRKGIEQEKRFVASRLGVWQGFDDNKEWFLKATLYKTQKNNIAVFIETICKASLLTNKKEWKESGDYLINPQKSELFIGTSPDEVKKNIPQELFSILYEHIKQEENSIEYLDI